MGEDKILDTRDHPLRTLAIFFEGISFAAGRMRQGACLLAVVIALLASGCGRLPRIVILDDPLTPEEHLNLGVSYEKNNELDDAVREYEAAAKHLPVAYLYLGNVFFTKGDLDEAGEYYRKAIDKDPTNADAFNNLAWLYYTQGKNLEEAEVFAIRALELNPAKADIYRDTFDKIRALRSR